MLRLSSISVLCPLTLACGPRLHGASFMVGRCPDAPAVEAIGDHGDVA